MEQTVRPGDNITLYCDCKLSIGVYIVWYRNCSHENQPSLVLSTRPGLSSFIKNYPRFEFVRNSSSESYDLLIMNVTDSDEGLYYCGTERTRVEDGKYIMKIYDYTYGNITTRITLRTQSLSKYSNLNCLFARTSIFDCGLSKYNHLTKWSSNSKNCSRYCELIILTKKCKYIIFNKLCEVSVHQQKC